MNKHLICIGFGKCGTTLLNYMLGRSPRFVTPIGKKEICYFHNDQVEYQNYLEHFDTPELPDDMSRVFFEASPPYATARNLGRTRATLERISFTVPDATVLLCFRHPAYRAYSHYVHNLQTFAAWGSGQYSMPADHPAVLLKSPFAQTFEETIDSIPSVRPNYFETIRMALEIFGKDHVKFFYLERDARHFSGFFDRLCADFELDVAGYWDSAEIPRVLPAGSMPSYIYCTDRRGLEMTASGGTFELSRGDLFVASARGCFIVEGVPPALGRRLSGNARRWTSKVGASEFARLFETYFEQDVAESIGLMRRYGLETEVFESYANYPYESKHLQTLSADVANDGFPSWYSAAGNAKLAG